MIRVIRCFDSKYYRLHSWYYIQKQTFLTSDYACNDAWKAHKSPFLNQINLNDFYNVLDQNYGSKGSISAIDVDIFANALKDATHLDELRDLLHKLRLSAETGNMLESTHQAAVRNYIQFGNIEDLISILKDPLNFGLFLDDYTSNILLNKLITSSDIEQAAQVASLVMLQEDYSNDITVTLCQYACYKFIIDYVKQPEPEVVDDKKKKVEEVKIRVKFLRNPYDDDHFDIKDSLVLSGKTLAWMSEKNVDNASINLQILGWLVYKKYEKFSKLCEVCVNNPTFKFYNEIIEYIKKEVVNVNNEVKPILETNISLLSKASQANGNLEEAIKTKIENAINRTHTKDMEKQQQLFETWSEIRQQKLDEQTHRLDRAKRIEAIKQKQVELQTQEQKLWFFENEEILDLQIDEKEKIMPIVTKKKSSAVDENYIPPVILPKRK